MGVNLTPIVIKKITSLEALEGRILAVDASIYLHEFLSLIRKRDGQPLTDRQGEITSHLVGLSFRTTRLLTDYHIRPVFVFDGMPPQLKQDEIISRRARRTKAEKEWKAALRTGDYATAYSKAVMTGRLTTKMIQDAKHLLDVLGIPWVQAPSEAEAQAAHITQRGEAWASASKDYDSLLFGAPRLVRYVTISGTEFLPSKGTARKLKPEIIDLESFLSHYDLTLAQLVDLAILVGTDFNKGIKGVGPKTSLKLIKRYGSLENVPDEIREKLPPNLESIRKAFLEPEVSDDFVIKWGDLDEDELYYFLCDEKGFSKNRVDVVVERMRRYASQRSLENWLKW